MNIVSILLKLAGLNTAFQTELGIYEPPGRDMVTEVPSGKLQEDYGWLGDVAEMEEWKDELIPQGLREFNYSIKNKRFASPPIKIFADDLADEQYGQLLIRIADLVRKALAFPMKLVRTLRLAGETTLCYDGQNMYSTTHSEGDSGTQSNLVTGTGTTDAQMGADFDTAWGLLFGYKTDKGSEWPRENSQLVIVAGKATYLVLRRKFMIADVTGGGTNPYYGLVKDVRLDQGITGNSWYLDDIAPMVKAFILQNRQPVEPRHTGPESSKWVLSDLIYYTAKWRGNAGFGQWRNSVKIKNS